MSSSPKVDDLESGEEIVVVKQMGIDRNVKIVMAVAFYFFVSMSLTFLNKRVIRGALISLCLLEI